MCDLNQALVAEHESVKLSSHRAFFVQKSPSVFSLALIKCWWEQLRAQSCCCCWGWDFFTDSPGAMHDVSVTEGSGGDGLNCFSCVSQGGEGGDPHCVMLFFYWVRHTDGAATDPTLHSSL